MEINKEKLKTLIEFYKTSFNEHWDEEKYKWQALKHFQDNWNIDAPDFAGMFEKATAKTSNLLVAQNYFPGAMIKNSAEKEPDTVRGMFRFLYDESKTLSERINYFQQEAERIRGKYDSKLKAEDTNSKGWGMHYQNDNAISTYLWLKYPEKYYIYKWSEYRNVAREVDCDVKFTKGHKENLENGFALYDSICEELQKNEELKEILKNKLTDDCYADEKLRTLTVDFGFHISRYFNDGQWLPKNYDPKISKEEWKVLIQNPDVFSRNSLITFACLYSEGIASCTDLEEKFGRNWQFYNNNGWRTGQKVFEKKHMEPPKDENNEIWFWSACCLFRKNEDGFWEFKMHPKLQDAFTETGILKNIELKEGASDMSESNDKAKELADLLHNTHNLILHGAPGTGKTYLARKIAEAMGCKENEIGFVQFHPSYDYTDFVEGLRPKNDSNGQIGFERKDGVFKTFCERALKNLTDSKKDTSEIEKETSIDENIVNFINKAIEENTEFEITTGNKFFITDIGEKTIEVSIPANEKVKELSLSRTELSALLSAETKIENGNDIRQFFNRKWRTQQDSYTIVLYKEIKAMKLQKSKVAVSKIERKNFVFIIDEINRGDMSKIFGELFFAIEPSYRGAERCKDLRTQYANLQETPNLFDITLGKKEDFGHFFIPENVYIIGTMNDIDRSVESMDFAFRRRFTFKEITAEDSQAMLTKENPVLANLSDELLLEIKNRMESLNKKIISEEVGLQKAYQIGGAYFLKIADYKKQNCSDTEAFENLWNYNLESLLHEYLRGMENENDKFEALKNAYNLTQSTEEED